MGKDKMTEKEFDNYSKFWLWNNKHYNRSPKFPKTAPLYKEYLSDFGNFMSNFISILSMLIITLMCIFVAASGVVAVVDMILWMIGV